jgi:probable DNA metabolism protein
MNQAELFEAPEEPDCGMSWEELETLSESRGTSAKGDTAYKMWKEADRLRGLLRFTQEGGRYTARCAPDYGILPLLADHFLLRFGETPWQIIDEKRGLVLRRERGKAPLLEKIPQNQREGSEPRPAIAGKSDAWEELWKNYHHSVNNESRTNPALQRQFMPRRYWKYLPEMENPP